MGGERTVAGSGVGAFFATAVVCVSLAVVCALWASFEGYQADQRALEVTVIATQRAKLDAQTLPEAKKELLVATLEARRRKLLGIEGNYRLAKNSGAALLVAAVAMSLVGATRRKAA